MYNKKIIIKKDEFGLYLNYARNLKFEEKPDYCWLKKLFKDLFYKTENDWDFNYDWVFLLFFLLLFK